MATPSAENGKMPASTSTSFWHFKSTRLQVVVLLFMVYFVLSYARQNFGMAMVCMVNSTALGVLTAAPETNITADGLGIFNASPADLVQYSECPVPATVVHDYEGEFVWTTTQQGMVFAVLSWGRLLGGPLGSFADRYSPKHLLCLSVFINVLGSALTPVTAVHGGHTAMLFVRFVMGLGQGLFIPSVCAFVSRWIPPNERSVAISIYTAGLQLSTVVAMPLNAWMCRLKHVLNGWPLVFYSAALFGLVWMALWAAFTSDRPEKSRRVCPAEKAYIVAAVRTQNAPAAKSCKSAPWRSVFTSLPVWACVLCNFGDGLLSTVMILYLPTYVMEVLHVGLADNGLYSAAPSIVQCVMKFVVAALSNYWKNAKRFTPTMQSKLFNTVGFLGSATFFFSCSFLTCTQIGLAVFCLCATLGLFAAAAPGFMSGQQALAPQYAGSVTSVTTGAFYTGGIVAPYFIGVITEHGTRSEWQIVFSSISAYLVFAGVFYIIFGSADVQAWAILSEKSEKSMPDVVAAPDQPAGSQTVLATVGRENVQNLDILPPVSSNFSESSVVKRL